MNLRQRIAAFLRGRYGVDRLGVFTVFLSLLLMFINSFVHSFVLLIIQSAVMGYWIFRCFSKNIRDFADFDGDAQTIFGVLLEIENNDSRHDSCRCKV